MVTWYQKHISHLKTAFILGDRIPPDLREVELIVRQMMHDWQYNNSAMMEYNEYVETHRLWNRYCVVWEKIEEKARTTIMFSSEK